MVKWDDRKQDDSKVSSNRSSILIKGLFLMNVDQYQVKN